MIDIRLPEINGKTSGEQLAQIRSYLYQFAGQLNWALNTLEKGQGGNDSLVMQTSNGDGATSQGQENDAIANFDSIKSLIIKSADIVEAYYEEIDKLLELSGKYTAQSDFADFTQETRNSISATSEDITQNYYKKETIDSKVKEIEDSIKVQEGYIRTGNVRSYLASANVDTEQDALGMEIGEFNSLNESSSKRYARFTSYGIELFGETKNSPPVAWMKQNKLYIRDAEFTGKVKFGGYEVDTSNGFSMKWVGRG